eukprot:NODE_2206_length_1482_cov_127.982340_g2097_i0.p1 GENE.NODE_2206_length_1482_cov_127.982340_g2097_i0~~NODE_2206_length_1482_cov_127.982340_g2097_i0.p1  ORF type:complete len:415 (+),score=114.46 NODE_2206_length_1482_cov_127.982340_g2097_i0:62-1306(+)
MRVLTLLALVGASFGMAPLLHTESPTRIEKAYIVVFHANATATARGDHSTMLTAMNVRPAHEYSISSFRGYAAKMEEAALLKVRSDPAVNYVEADQTVSINDLSNTTELAKKACSLESDATWGISRISYAKPGAGLDEYHFPATQGNGVDVYVVDTGVQITHNEFADGSRAIWGANFADKVDKDCNGHGTHVAGTVAGRVYGVAKKARVIAVKVLGCDGSGTNSGVIAGVDYTAKQGGKSRSVSNLSLGGGKSTALNAASNACVEAGITMVVAAGNENANACNGSPSSATDVITVGATAQGVEPANQDTRSSFSNWGPCVDIFAPGSAISAAWIDQTGYPKNSVINTISGTSMASPHVAGVVALGRAASPSVTDWKTELNSKAQTDLIKLGCTNPFNACSESPNRFLYSYWCNL